MNRPPRVVCSDNNRKMNLGDLPNTAILFVFVAVIFVAGFLVLDGLDTDLTANSYGANASANVQEGMDNITSYAPTWGTIVGVAVLLAIVIGGFGYGRNKGYF